MFKGACEYEHFEFLNKLGINSFILVNNPTSDTFISLKTIEKVINNFNFKEIFFSNLPKTHEGFEYYSKIIKPSGLIPKYIEGNESSFLEINNLNQLENFSSRFKKLSKGKIIIDLKLFMETYRDLNKKQFLVFFNGIYQ